MIAKLIKKMAINILSRSVCYLNLNLIKQTIAKINIERSVANKINTKLQINDEFSSIGSLHLGSFVA